MGLVFGPLLSEIRSLDVKNGLIYKNAPHTSARRRLKIFEVFSEQMKGKRVFGGVWAPQARKKFACGAKTVGFGVISTVKIARRRRNFFGGILDFKNGLV